MLAERRRIVREIEKRLSVLPEWARPYALAMAALVGAAAIADLLYHTGGTKAALLISLIGDLLVLGSAWLGYGPGILVCTLTVFVVPRVLLPSRPVQVDPGRFGLLIILCLLVSRLAGSKRRTEAALRQLAGELEHRVEQRTREIQLNEQRLREQAELLDLAPVAILAIDSGGIIGFWSRGAEQMYGWPSEEAVGKRSHDFFKTVFPIPLEQIQQRLATVGFWEGELIHTRRDGSQVQVLSRWAPQWDSAGRISGSLEINSDVTERRRVEEHLQHNQRLESVGLLAGGVAHDFNNLLTVINGYADMALGDLTGESPIRDSLIEIRAAGDRAAGLTQQLLAFGRRQVLNPTVLSLNVAVQEAERMLRRLIGEDIEIVTHLDPAIASVRADAGQIQQIIINLAINARDAMPEGGTLIIETANVSFDEDYCTEHPEVQPGPCVRLAVTDTGTGMTQEVKRRIFEPFFTTKPKGAGTGLGLATVYGIVKQSGGWIWAYSEEGHGTSFKIYLPATEITVSESTTAARVSLNGTETILLVEDQPEVRNLAGTVLRRYGYTVMEASHGQEGLRVSGEFDGTIDLLITDVIMPGMNGLEMANQMRPTRPGMKVLCISGYPESTFSQRGILEADVAYLQKPFSPEVLGKKVREVLGSSVSRVDGRTAS